MISIKLHSSRISPTILKSSPRFYFFNLNFDYLKFSMLSFTSQKPQLPIHSINKIMLNSSNFLLKCAPKPYPKVWFYQLVLGGCTTKDIFSFFVFFFLWGAMSHFHWSMICLKPSMVSRQKKKLWDPFTLS